MFVDINLINSYNFHNFGGFRVPNLTYREKFSLARSYFPMIINQSDILEKNKEEYIDFKESIFDKIDKYKIKGKNDEYYLNIPEMAKDKKGLYRHILPPPEIVDKYIDELNNKVEKGERPNIIEFFIKVLKKDEYFLSELNIKLDDMEADDSLKLASSEIILDEFLSDIIFYWYPETKPGLKIKKDIYWTFFKFNYQHSGTTVYDVFNHFAQKWCTLYLIGADFVIFKNNPSKWPVITSLNLTLPECLSKNKDITQGLDSAFEYINTGDFIPLSTDTESMDKEWDPFIGAKYFLHKINLNITDTIYHTDICYSFCIPVLNNNISSNCKDIGKDIIETILFRDLENVEGLISRDPNLWKNEIDNILEGISRKPASLTDEASREYYLPSPFEFDIVIQKAWGLRYGFKHKIFKPMQGRSTVTRLTEKDYITLQKFIINKFSIAFNDFENDALLMANWRVFLNKIRNADIIEIKDDLRPYLYDPDDKQQRTKGRLFRNYCHAMDYDWSDRRIRSNKHTFFQRRVRTFANDVITLYNNMREFRSEEYE